MNKRSPESTELVLEAYQRNTATIREIGNQFGLSPSTILQLARKRGLPFRQRRGRRRLSSPTPWHNAIIEQARVEVYTVVGKRFGISRQRVHQILKRFFGPQPKRSGRATLRQFSTESMTPQSELAAH